MNPDDFFVPQGQRGHMAVNTAEDDPLSDLLRQRLAQGQAYIQPGGVAQPGAGDELLALINQRMQQQPAQQPPPHPQDMNAILNMLLAGKTNE